MPLHEWTELVVGPGAGSVADLTTWLFEEGSFTPAAKLTAQGAQSVVTDHLGTPLSMYDGQGRATWQAQLDSYGAVRQGRGKARHCPFRYQGQYEDTETGLYYNRFRYYDPEAGQYISQDPLGLWGGLPVYGYVPNPLGWVDPLGLAPGSGLITYPITPALTPWAGGREAAIERAWVLEHHLVSETGAGTRTWNPTEIALIKSTSNGEALTSLMTKNGYTRHHINSVKNNGQLGLDWQDDPRNIVFLENGKHPGGYNNHVHGVEGHNGMTHNVTRGDLIDRQQMLDRHRQSLAAATCP